MHRKFTYIVLFALCLIYPVTVYAVDPMPVPRTNVGTTTNVGTATPSPNALPRATLPPTAIPSATPLPAPVTPRMLYFGDSISQIPGFTDISCNIIRCTRVNQDNTLPLAKTVAAYPGGTLMFISTERCNDIPCAITSYSTRVAPFSYDYINIEFGTNDTYYIGLNGISLDAWGNAWDSLYAQMPNDVRAKAYVMGLPYITGYLGTMTNPAATSWSDLRTKLDAITQAKAAQYGVTYISLFDMPASYISTDMIHPNLAGMQYMSDRMLAAMHLPKPR